MHSQSWAAILLSKIQGQAQSWPQGPQWSQCGQGVRLQTSGWQLCLPSLGLHFLAESCHRPRPFQHDCSPLYVNPPRLVTAWQGHQVHPSASCPRLLTHQWNSSATSTWAKTTSCPETQMTGTWESSSRRALSREAVPDALEPSLQLTLVHLLHWPLSQVHSCSAQGPMCTQPCSLCQRQNSFRGRAGPLRLP